MYTIYHLICPKSNEIRYVGQTKKSLEIRLSQHIKLSKRKTKKKYHVNFWIEKLLMENLEPSIKSVHQNLTKNEANELEKYEIENLSNKGNKLCNLTNGGDTFLMSDETKIKMRNSKLGEKNSFYGKTHTEETKKLIKEKAIGRFVSEETKKKLSIRFSGERNNMFGRPSPLKTHTEETKKLISYKKSKEWRFLNPENELVVIFNLLEFCKQNNLHCPSMHRVAKGVRNSYKKWKRAF